MRIDQIVTKIRGTDAEHLVRGLAAYGGAEAATRIVRIFSVVIIARQVSPATMGGAAVVLTLFELVRVLANAGIGQRIISQSAGQLAATCNSAHHLFKLWCVCVAAFQLLLAVVIHLAFGMGEVAAMLALLAGVYLIMPGGLVQIYLLMREGRMATTARIGATQTMTDHCLTLALVLIWPSAWAIILPKLLTAPIWLALVRRARPWQPCPEAGHAPFRHFLGFGIGVLVTELVIAGRAQLDKLIVGTLFGVKALGIYYFAFNAGLGITTSFVTALGTVLFPYICRVQMPDARLSRARLGMRFALLIFLPVVAAQVVLAPFYVPLVFGPQWEAAAPLVAILGLGALPMVLAAVATAWLRSQERPALDALISVVATGAAVAGLAIASPFGLLAAASGYVAGLSTTLIPSSLWLLRHKTGAAPRFQESMA